MPPPLVSFPNQSDYRIRYNETYVIRGPVVTFDGLRVKFVSQRFDHAFFCDSARGANDKAIFDMQRAERIDWIRALLQDPDAEVYRRVLDDGTLMRIALWPAERYCVVVESSTGLADEAFFVTAYVVDAERSFRLMRSNPKW